MVWEIACVPEVTGSIELVHGGNNHFHGCMGDGTDCTGAGSWDFSNSCITKVMGYYYSRKGARIE